MDVRFHLDPDTTLPHIYGHGVTEDEAEYILRHPGQDRSGRDRSRHAMGQTDAGRYLRVIDSAEEAKMSEPRFPAGWDADRVKSLIDHYEAMSEEELVAEDEAASDLPPGQTVVTVPEELMPAIRQLLAAHETNA